MSRMQQVLSLIFPDQCVLCGELTDGADGLCPSCWRETPFIGPPYCDLCGAPLLGEATGDDVCDACLSTPRPWAAGRAAVRYADKGRHLVMAFKHGDRTDLAPVLAQWLRRAGEDLLSPDTVLVPVPIHWTRLFTRQYNQSTELAVALARCAPCRLAVDALVRTRHTPSQGNRPIEERFDNVMGKIAVGRNGTAQLAGRNVCLIDDVMTSGATFAACADVCHAAGASRVSVLMLARAAKAP